MYTYQESGYTEIGHVVRTMNVHGTAQENSPVDIRLAPDQQLPLRVIVVDHENNPVEFEYTVDEAQQRVVMKVFAPDFTVRIRDHGTFSSRPVLAPRPKRDDDDGRGERVLV